jgi:hypothetical protein
VSGSAPPRDATTAKAIGWGGLAVVVLVAALRGGFIGAAIMFGLYALVAGLVAVVRGRARWAQLGGWATGGAVLGAALVAMIVASVTARRRPRDAGQRADVSRPDTGRRGRHL